MAGHCPRQNRIHHDVDDIRRGRCDARDHPAVGRQPGVLDGSQFVVRHVVVLRLDAYVLGIESDVLYAHVFQPENANTAVRGVLNTIDSLNST